MKKIGVCGFNCKGYGSPVGIKRKTYLFI